MKVNLFAKVFPLWSGWGAQEAAGRSVTKGQRDTSDSLFNNVCRGYMDQPTETKQDWGGLKQKGVFLCYLLVFTFPVMLLDSSVLN